MCRVKILGGVIFTGALLGGINAPITSFTGYPEAEPSVRFRAQPFIRANGTPKQNLRYASGRSLSSEPAARFRAQPFIRVFDTIQGTPTACSLIHYVQSDTIPHHSSRLPNSAFCIIHSQFCILHSAFYILNSEF